MEKSIATGNRWDRLKKKKRIENREKEKKRSP